MSKTCYLVTYDIRESRRLRRVAKTLEGYGTRIQYSVFRCRLRPRELERMQWELTKILDPSDELLIVGLCDGCASRIRTKGQKNGWKQEEVTFLIV